MRQNQGSCFLFQALIHSFASRTLSSPLSATEVAASAFSASVGVGTAAGSAAVGLTSSILLEKNAAKAPRATTTTNPPTKEVRLPPLDGADDGDVVVLTGGAAGDGFGLIADGDGFGAGFGATGGATFTGGTAVTEDLFGIGWTGNGTGTFASSIVF